jgi:hypothetical protein
MKLTVQRDQLDPDCTLGRMLIDGEFYCHTLEDTVRAPGVKVYAQTAIPEGEYGVIVNMSNRFKQLMPLVLNVPGFEGIRIHPGNTAADTEGCILVGRKRFPKFIGESRLAYAPLLARMQAAIAAGRRVTLAVRNG